MPIISRFLGIVIAIYYDDHNPPHFHAKYGDYEITFDIETGVIAGRFPKRALKLVIEWGNIHKKELLDNWEKARKQEPLSPVPPLE